MTDQANLLTIGHSNHGLDDFLALLREAEVDAVADVRSSPRSRYVPWFDKPALGASLEHAQIRYVFLGEELGGRPPEDDFYDAEGHVLYHRVAGTERFLTGIERLDAGLDDYRVAIMCAEEDPAHCHRRLLVAKVLIERGVSVEHIRKDGRIEAEQGIGPEPALFDEGESWWRSTQSVSPKRQRLTSSAG